MRRPVIGITCNYAPGKDDSINLQLDVKYADAIRIAGGLPQLIPVSPAEEIPALLELYDGLLFSGGGGLQPHILAMESLPGLYEQNPVRHAFEIALAKAAIAQEKPLMGICRGHQTINEALGGTLKNIGNKSHLQQEPGDTATHEVTLLPGSRLYPCCDLPTLWVNSFHQQMVDLPGQGLWVTARSTEGYVEAIEGEGEAFIMGLQFHPESMMPDNEKMTAIYALLIEAARQRMSKN